MESKLQDLDPSQVVMRSGPAAVKWSSLSASRPRRALIRTATLMLSDEAMVELTRQWFETEKKRGRKSEDRGGRGRQREDNL